VSGSLLVGLGAACQPIAPSAPSSTQQAPAKTGQGDQPRPGGRLRLAHDADFSTFNPYNLNLVNRPQRNQIFNRLIVYGPGLAPTTELAESWELSADSLTMKLSLRKGVQFHNGRELVADDVAFSMERVLDPKTGANIRSLATSVEKVETPDKYTAVLRFNAPIPAIFDFFDLFYIVNKETYDKISNQPVGTGPFSFAEWLNGDHATFKKFSNYWRKPYPYLDEVIVSSNPDTQASLIALETGQLDVVEDIPFNAIKRLTAEKKVQIIKVDAPATVYAAFFNVTRKPFDNKLVRQGMNYALDRQRFVDTSLAGASEPWYQPFAKTSMAYFPDLDGQYKFDLAKAEQLFQQAGYGSGFEFTMLNNSSTPELTGAAQIWQADLAKIGVTMKIEVLEQAVIFPRVRDQQDYQATMWAYGRPQKDPASLFAATQGWNETNSVTKFDSAEYKAAVQDAAKTADPAKRKALYRRAVEIALDECFSIAIAPQYSMWAASPAVRDLDWNVEAYETLERTWLAST
jgi:peptide/nickel transport system substrate-binding protein